MTDKWVTSFRFNEIKNKKMIGFLIDFIFCRLAETTASGSLSVMWLPGSDVSLGIQCGCHLRFFSKLCMCVVDKKVNYADPRYNNVRAPAVRRKWITFIQFQRADFLTVPHHAHLSSKHFSECDFTNPMEYRYSFKILPGRLELIRLYPCGSLRQSIGFVFRARVGHFAVTPQSDIVGQKMPFFVHL